MKTRSIVKAGIITGLAALVIGSAVVMPDIYAGSTTHQTAQSPIVQQEYNTQREQKSYNIITTTARPEIGKISTFGLLAFSAWYIVRRKKRQYHH